MKDKFIYIAIISLILILIINTLISAYLNYTEIKIIKKQELKKTKILNLEHQYWTIKLKQLEQEK